jgi:hypothetical protein
LKSNLLLDIAELALSFTTPGKNIASVKTKKLYKNFFLGNTLCKSKASIPQLREAVATILPFHKNNHKKNKFIKISVNKVYLNCEELDLKLRPIEHIQKKGHSD